MKKNVYVYLNNHRITGFTRKIALEKIGVEKIDFLKCFAFIPGSSVSQKFIILGYEITIVVKCCGCLCL